MTYRHLVFQSVYKLGTRRIIAAHSIIHVRKNVAASGLIMNTVYSNPASSTRGYAATCSWLHFPTRSKILVFFSYYILVFTVTCD